MQCKLSFLGAGGRGDRFILGKTSQTRVENQPKTHHVESGNRTRATLVGGSSHFRLPAHVRLPAQKRLHTPQQFNQNETTELE